MLSIRFVTAGAVLLLVSGLAAGGAGAQDAAPAPGKPLQLLKIVEQPNKTKIRPHEKRLSRHISKARFAVAKREPARPARTADATPPANIQPAPTAWPATDAPAPIAVAAATAAPLPPAPAPAALNPGELVVGGQTVQVASPNEVNDIDLAADDTSTQSGAVAPGNAAPSTQTALTNATTDAVGPKSDSVNAAPTQPQGSPVGSTSWLLQVFAALGGAVTAGSLAWFMIGSAPQRTYG